MKWALNRQNSVYKGNFFRGVELQANGLISPVVYSSVWTVIFNKCEALSVDLKTEQGEKPLPDTRGWIKTESSTPFEEKTHKAPASSGLKLWPEFLIPPCQVEPVWPSTRHFDEKYCFLLTS